MYEYGEDTVLDFACVHGVWSKEYGVRSCWRGKRKGRLPPENYVENKVGDPILKSRWDFLIVEEEEGEESGDIGCGKVGDFVWI